MLKGAIAGTDPEDVESLADLLYGRGNYRIVFNTLPNDKTIAIAIPSVQGLTYQVSELTVDQLRDPTILAKLSSNASNLVNVLLPVKYPDMPGVSKFYYIVTRLDLLGGNGGLGNPIATFDNVDALQSFLRSAPDPENLMVLTDGTKFMVYPRSLYVITTDQLKDPNILAMLSTNANTPDMVNVLLYERPTGPFDTPKFYYFVTRQDLSLIHI